MTTTECTKCEGTGEVYYSNTATYRSAPGVISGQAFTWGTCNKCWGSGDQDNPGENLLEKEQKEWQSRNPKTK